ncbi:MBL fold metallo-hydrolase [Burkholderia multivorans]|uniref:MBL fold metallo-hydrolase n=2 Tax=Burkholderia multivorans TaxID=87883 RepID=UPI000CFFA9B3|nr:MBL fold metallo-hydrolase [Burkholderia multivorans]MBU9185972.1 MBL fold metallo-hydrolase [Burkholderia multivorans]MDN7437482.1 MBL fold metallo-hydrolase [Burkholderia multivorans]PRE33156.1 MBL fold metallo-hydrolase [Burkholderia multivorans]
MDKPQIITISILPFGMVHCHLVISSKGCVLVDTGIPGSVGKIERVLKKHGRSFRDINLIIITHAHTDHAGSAAQVRQLSGAPILAHAGDLDYYERRKEMTYCVAHWWGPLFLRSGLPGEPYTAFTPDILLQDDASVDLSPYGLDGVVRHTPGHTDGSVSVELVSGEALVGDLLASGILIGGMMRTGHAMRPPFEEDPQAVTVELLGMVNTGMKRFHMGHGGPLGAEEVRRHAKSLQQLAPGPRYGMQPVGCSCSKRKVALIAD